MELNLKLSKYFTIRKNIQKYNMEHKHRTGHVVEVEITPELLKQFEEDAEIVFSEMENEMEISKETKENLIRGYVIAKIVAYRKNNGIPPIPFPVSFSTVDMICFSQIENEGMILLGRKPGQEKWQFPGGFRDPKETSKHAAKRELMEEVSLNIELNRFVFIDDMFIDDIRYRNSPHKVTTNIFYIYINENEMNLAKAADDLGEIKWFSLTELMIDSSIIREIHLPLFELFMEEETK